MSRYLVMLVTLLCSAVQAEGWADNLKIGGDFRYRHDYVKQDSSDDRSRHQIRLRLNIEGRVNEYAKVATQLSTGYDNPTSANQTLTDGFSSKSVALNLAYVEIDHRLLGGLVLQAGKAPSPWFKPGGFELIWDNDLNPEGLSARYAANGSRLSARLAGAWFWVEERQSQIESYLAGGQTVVTYSLPDERASIATGVSYYTYINIRGFPTFYDETRSFGNSVDTSDGYLWDFELVELLAEANVNTCWFPVRVAANLVINTTADSLETGWLTGVIVGRTSKPGSFSVQYSYRKLEKDATIGVFTNNAFGGGGTDLKGHEVKLALQIAANTSLQFNYYNNKVHLATPRRYQRLQLDLRLNF